MENTGASAGFGRVWAVLWEATREIIDPVGQEDRAFIAELGGKGCAERDGLFFGYVVNNHVAGGRELKRFATKEALEAAQTEAVSAAHEEAMRADEDRTANLWIQADPKPKAGAILRLADGLVMYRAIVLDSGELSVQRLTEQETRRIQENEVREARIKAAVLEKSKPLPADISSKQRATEMLMNAINFDFCVPESTRKQITVEVDGQFFGFDQGDPRKIIGPAPTKSHILVHNGLVNPFDAAALDLNSASSIIPVHSRRFVALDGMMYGCVQGRDRFEVVSGRTEAELAKRQATVWMSALEEGAKPGAYIEINGRFYGPLMGLNGSYAISAGYDSIPDLEAAKARAIASKEAFDQGLQTVRETGSWAISQTGRFLGGVAGSLMDVVATGVSSVAEQARGAYEQHQRQKALEAEVLNAMDPNA